MPRVWELGIAASGALLLVGCNGAPITQPRDSIRPAYTVVGLPGDGQVAGEEFEVCKYGSSATFSYSVTDHNNGNAVSTGQFTLADGQCQVLVQAGGFGSDVSVTEQVPNGFALNHVDVTRLSNGTTTSSTQTSATVSGLASGAKSTPPLQGVLAKYYNQALPPSGSIGDFVWLDANGNGIQDVGEAGLPGITVTLSGAANATTTTNASGFYLFSGLSAGNYTVTVGTPAGYMPSPSNQGGNPQKDSNGSPASVTLPTNSSNDLSIDFGFLPQLPVCTPSSNPSNFNGTAVAPGSTIWFNAVFKPKGVPASGGTVNFTGAKIAITSGGNQYNVSLPNSRITFSPSASSASTTYDVPTNTWITVVPVSYTGNVFLSGVGYAPPGGLPGGANPVTWSGQFTTNMTGFSTQWQWAAAVYTSFGALGSIGVKPIDGNTLNPYPNSDHAGTPESFKSFVVGGARGGGGSNWTGSYSGTVSPPVCVY